MSKAQITIPLNIPDVRVLHTSVSERGEIIITIESTKVGTKCRKCGKLIKKLHSRDEWVLIRHMPAFGRPTYLRYRPHRYQCQDCEGQPTTTQELDWHDPNSPQSFAYDNHLLLQLVNSTVEDISQKEGLPYGKVAGVLKRRIERQVDWAAIEGIEILGLDEIALKKGHRDYVTLVTGRMQVGENRILGVLAGHEKAEVLDFLGSRKVSKVFAAICGRRTQKRRARCCRAPGSWQTVFMWPDTTGMQQMKFENTNSSA